MHKDIEKIETQIISSFDREIKLERIWNKREETAEEFVVKFFTIFNDNRNTIYEDNRQVYERSGKRRSLGDLYMIFRYYYPELRLDELLKLLYIILPSRLRGFRSSYCFSISKRVWYYDENRRTNRYNSDLFDEFGNDVDFYLERLV